MSIEVKPGRWRLRGGEIAIVVDNGGSHTWRWRGRLIMCGNSMSWAADGRYCLTDGPSDLVEFLGKTEDDPGTIKHNAAKALVASAEALKSMLDPEHDGTHAMRLAEFIIVNARVLEALTRPEIADDTDDS